MEPLKTASDSIFTIHHPGRFLGAAISSTVILGAIVYPMLESYPQLIAIPIVCGAAVSMMTEIWGSRSSVREIEPFEVKMLDPKSLIVVSQALKDYGLKIGSPAAKVETLTAEDLDELKEERNW